MQLTPGSRLGPYEITGPLGAGGMGEVYRARDTRLNRDVALKVLPAAVARDAERLARFEREAQLLGALNHPGIGSIYGLEESSGQNALVLELVEGPTLADRLAQGPIPVVEALPIARQIAEALEAAHEQGIVHRDLKPANIKLRPDGAVKVLDFGLAKALDTGTQSGLDLAHSPTLTTRATQQGIILGTAAYMAPEQAKGQAVDKRADIWAFGVVLYEMLTGQRLFAGDTASEVLAAVILKVPELAGLPVETPPPVRQLLQRCLDREPRRRLRDIGEARVVLADPRAGAWAATGGAPAAGRARPAARRWVVWTAAALAVALGVSLVLLFRASRPVVRSVARYDVRLPAGTLLDLASRPAVALSRDGSTLVFASTREGVTRLYIKKREEPTAKPLDGTEGASNPVVSPDGRWVAFFAENQLKKAALDGAVVQLAPVNDPRGLRWLDAGTLVYAPSAIGPLFTVPVSGGTPRAITSLDTARQERSHRWPEVLPGGKVVLFTVGTLGSPDSYEDAAIAAVDVSTGARRAVLEGASMVQFFPPRTLVLARGGSLYGVHFDARRLAVEGAPVLLVTGVAGDLPTGAVHCTISEEGTLAYVPGSAQAGLRRLVWRDRNGRMEPVDLAPGNFNDPRISPDGSRVAVAVGASGSADIWIHDFKRKTFTRLTFEKTNGTPLWSADGAEILYAAVGSTGQQTKLYRGPADGSREAEAIMALDTRAYLGKGPRDGSWVLVDYFNLGGSGKTDVIRMSIPGTNPPIPIAATPFDEYAPAASPDGRWVAYQSDESGRDEIYVRASSGAGGRWQISTIGGEEPVWSPEGRELYFRSGSRFMAVPVDAGPRFSAGTPRVLFDGVFRMRSDTGISYDVDPTGNRFLMIRPLEDDESASSLRVVLNWGDEVSRLVAPAP